MGKEKKHILVVDDDEGIRTLLGRFLREQGFILSLAQNASQALMRRLCHEPLQSSPWIYNPDFLLRHRP